MTADDDEYGGDLDADGDPSCCFCGGEPWAMECADPLQCGCSGNHCDACGNTGLAKNQVAW